MLYIVLLIFLLVLVASFFLFKKPSTGTDTKQDISIAAENLRRPVQEPKEISEDTSRLEPVQKTSIAENKKQAIQLEHRFFEEQPLLFEDVQNPVFKKLEDADSKHKKETIEAKSDLDKQYLQENPEEKNLLIHPSRNRTVYPEEAHLQELEKKFLQESELSPQNKVIKGISLPSLQDFQKAPEERIEAISPVLKSAIIEDEEEDTRPIFEHLEEKAHIQDVDDQNQKILEEKQESSFMPHKATTEKFDLISENSDEKSRIGEEKCHPEFRQQAHFMPDDFLDTRSSSEQLYEKRHPEFTKEAHFAPEDFRIRVESSGSSQRITEHSLNLPSAQTNLDHPLSFEEGNKQTLGKNTVKRNFNFRSNKNKIESILKHDNLIVKDHISSDLSLDKDNSTLSAPESAVDRSRQAIEDQIIEKEGVIEKDLLKTLEKKHPSMKPRGFNFKNRSVNNILENSLNKSNQSAQPEKETDKENISYEDRLLKVTETNQAKPKGFNFKNPRIKILKDSEIRGPAEVSAPLEMRQSENLEPLRNDDKLEDSSIDINKAETKKMKGFNFRNSNRLKNQ